MNSEEPFAELMTRLRQGDDAAAAEVFHHFVRRLIGFTRGQLETWVRLKTDPEDVVQSVYKSFFTRYEAGQFAVADWDSLWGLLTCIAVRKCANHARFWQAARRESGREVSLPPDAALEDDRQLLAREPTPAEAAALTDTLEHLMQDLSATDRAILVLHLQGREIPAISTEVARSERTVRRTLELVRLQLCRLQQEDAPEPRP
jgi:RNA polymerase sigma-70 factor (ECF subfamily)